MKRHDAVVFDFDGVIADSEVHANQALAESLSEIGLATTYDDCLRDYCGHNWQETQRRIELRLGGPLPADFRETHREHGRVLFGEGLAAVPGAADFLDRLADRPRAVASSSRREYLDWALGRLGLAHHFGEHLYSADGLARGKPHPDIYLTAAHGLGVSPERCLAIEDSPVGAQAAVAAGMTVVGLVAASHIADRARHAEQLRSVGVHTIAYAFEEIDP
ncbi:MAG TPA: HAD family phosphatase [Novosphingobium sp.]|nr:HAD family phosphatase [Novosphingobium sp.]